MIPFWVMIIAIAIFRASGALGAPFLDDWLIATRLGLGVMFLFTATAHFGRQRGDLVRMVPRALPAPGFLVTLTGVLEFGLGLLLIWPDTARPAALGLIALLVLVFPANIHAARTAHTIAGRRHTPMMLRAPLQAAWIGLLAWSGVCRSCIRGDVGDPGKPIVVTRDLHRFVTYVAPDGVVDTSCRTLPAYFSAATPGLTAYRHRFGMAPADLCRAMHRVPQRYAELADRADRFDSVGAQVAAAFERFKALYPDARFVPVYIVVGNGVSAGTTTLGREPAILIGAELSNKTAGLARTIVHELMHVQQEYPAWGAMTGGPAFMRGSLLRHAVKEGAADFLTELVLGPFTGTREAWASAHEAQLWSEFRRDMHGTDLDRWLYNGWNLNALGARPPDLGYYMGYVIAKSYYEHAADKAAAVRDILTIRDFDRFLAKSGYAPPLPPASSGEPVHVGA